METVTISEDAIVEFIDDPSLISSKEEGFAVIDVIDSEIANIDSQIEAAKVIGNIDEGWLHRATYAKAMKFQEKHRIYRRCNHLRFMKGGPDQQERTAANEIKAQANLEKQQRLRAEADARRAGKVAAAESAKTEQMRVANARREIKRKLSVDYHFRRLAADVLDAGALEALTAAAEAAADNDSNI